MVCKRDRIRDLVDQTRGGGINIFNISIVGLENSNWKK